MCKVQEGEAGEAEEEEVAEAAALITIVGLLLKGNTRHKGGAVLVFFDCLRYLSHISTLREGKGERGATLSELARLQFQLGVFMATTAEWELQCRHPLPLQHHPLPHSTVCQP